MAEYGFRTSKDVNNWAVWMRLFLLQGSY